LTASISPPDPPNDLRSACRDDLNPGESPLEGARREFEEETGYFPRRIEPLGTYNQFPGTLVAFTHLFFATDLGPDPPKLR